MVKTIIPRQWQINSMENWFNNGLCGIDIAGTGTGKTISAIQKLLKLRKNTLIIVPTEVLMKQWEQEIKDFVDIPHDKIGLYYGSKKEIKPITIAIKNSVASSDFDFTSYFKFMVADEIHNLGTDNYLEFLEKNNFQYKIGLTATLERQDGNHKELIRLFGGINYHYTEQESKNDGNINKFTFISYGITLPDDEMQKYNEYEEKLNKYIESIKEITKEDRIDPFADVPNEHKSVSLYKMHYRKVFAQERKFMFSHYMKNREAIKLIEKHKDKKILVFNELNDNADLIYKVLVSRGLKPLILNTTNKKHTKKILEQYNCDEHNILIATKVLDEGFNLPKINVAIIVAGSSTKKQVKQRVGRAIRLSTDASIIYQLFLVGTRDEMYASKRERFIDYADDYKTIIV